MYIISIILVIAVTCLFTMSFGGLVSFSVFIDIPSLIGIILICIPVLMASGLWKDFGKAFSIALKKDKDYSVGEIKRSIEAVSLMTKTVLITGILMCVIALLTILRMVENLALLGPNIAVALLSLLYGIFFAILFMPLKSRLSIKMVDAMKED